MKTTEVRDMTWEEIQSSLDGRRAYIWTFLRQHGAATTSVIADKTGISLLTVRPRVCELVQAGLAECIDRRHKEGVYRALSLEEARARFDEACREGHPELFTL